MEANNGTPEHDPPGPLLRLFHSVVPGPGSEDPTSRRARGILHPPPLTLQTISGSTQQCNDDGDEWNDGDDDGNTDHAERYDD
eukprot:131451-Hanusia_phi.AAC.3